MSILFLEPPIYANLSELAKMAAEKAQQDQDNEKTPTSKHPPSGPHVSSCVVHDSVRIMVKF